MADRIVYVERSQGSGWLIGGCLGCIGIMVSGFILLVALAWVAASIKDKPDDGPSLKAVQPVDKR